ncbi:MAG: exodeoxyribonuclease V subunit gamma, partial [Propionibacteriales bacterium]|nr:exodeoxyribonuclease V subunit gamma [Propionibacteriales bacterium]
MALTIHRAERADVLAEGLAGLLAEPPDDPFERDLVVVAAAGVERWLAQTLSHRLGTAAGHDDGICAGVSFVRPLHLLTELTEKERDDPWAPRRLAWVVLDVIQQHLDEPWLAIVARHVGHGLEPREEALRRSRRYPTAKRIASLLHGYAVQRPWMVQSWTAGDDVDGVGAPLVPEVRWQAEIWRRAHALLDGHPSPDLRLADTATRLREHTLDPDLPRRLSFFGHTRMPHAELDVVGALADTRDVHLWLPHPSRTRWDEVARSLDESPRQPVRRDTVETPDTGNTLLAACARDVGELERSLLTLPGDTTTHHLPGPARPVSLLGHLQADLAADRDGPDGDPRDLDPLDQSVQVHACHGPARQVDVLREVVVGLLADDPTLEPRDVLVMCPDVETFAPLVEAAFGLDDVPDVDHPGHRLRVRLADRATGATNPVADVLQKVVAIAAARRTTATEVRDLLSLAPVRRRFALTDDDLEQIDEWTVQTAIRWGVDADARAAWHLGGLAQNTWRSGLQRLALGVVTDGHDDPDAHDGTHTGNRLGGVLPLDDLGSTGVDLVGRFTEAVERLAAVLDASRPQPVDEWVELLTTAVHTLTDVPTRDAWQREQVLRVLADLTRADTAPAARGTLTVVEVAAFLTDAFAPRPTRTSFRTGSLTVCTMVPMRSVPHRVVILLGLDDEVFPRVGSLDGDDVLARDPAVGERDIRSEDRQLLLDAVMSAEEKLLLFYTGADPVDGSTKPPAIPLRELMDVLDVTAGRSVEHRHPLQPFDPRNFEARHPFSFDTVALAGAVSQQRPSVPVPLFLPDALPPANSGDVELADVIAFVENPVQAFLRQRLGFRVPELEDDLADSLDIELDPLSRWNIGDRMLAAVLAGTDIGEFADAEWRRGTLPPFHQGRREMSDIRRVVGIIADAAAPFHDGPAETTDIVVDLCDGRRLTGTVIGIHDRTLVRSSYSRLAAKHRLAAWVRLLAVAASEPGEWSAVTIGRASGMRPPRRSRLTTPPNPLAV